MLRFLEKGAKKMVGIIPVFKIDGTQEQNLAKKFIYIIIMQILKYNEILYILCILYYQIIIFTIDTR